MTYRSKSHALCVAASLALMTIAPASAFAAPAMQEREQASDGRDVNTTRQQPGRLQNREQRPQNNRRQQQAPAAPTPEAIQAEAQSILTANNIACQLTNSSLHGETPDKQKLFEVTCANDFGYLLLTPTETLPGTNITCIEISATQARALAANPEAVVGPKCTLPGNDQFLPVLARYGTEAGLACTVNEGNIIGRKGDFPVYELGCDGADGARVNRTASGWELSTCLELVSANVACSYTTKEEQNATVKTWFAGSDAAACDVAEVRYMGANANGSFYEAKCNGTEGIIARLDNAKAVQQVYPCAEAAQIGGGCKLTEAAPEARS